MSREDDDRPSKGGKQKLLPPAASVHVAPEADYLAKWLARQWRDGQKPSRLEVWQVSGRKFMSRGRCLYHHDFKGNDTLDIEKAAVIANEIVTDCQDDCDKSRRAGTYVVAILDNARGAEPIEHLLGPLKPKRHYAETDGSEDGGGEDGEESDEYLTTGKSIGLAYQKSNLEHFDTDKTRTYAVMGDLISLYRDELASQRQENASLRKQNLELIGVAKDAAISMSEQKMKEKWEELKLDIARDGFRMGRNLLPGTITATVDALSGKDGEQSAGRKQLGDAVERTLVGNLLADVEADGELERKVLGAWDDNGKQTAAGILTKEQVGILLGVRDGDYPVDALDRLGRDCGLPTAITMKQTAELMSTLPMSILQALQEISTIRAQKQAALAAAKEANQKAEA